MTYTGLTLVLHFLSNKLTERENAETQVRSLFTKASKPLR